MKVREIRPLVEANLKQSALDAAIARATGFLRERLRSGTYGLALVGSDGIRFNENKGHVFVASFITDAMTGLLDEIDRTIILVRILSEENGGMWGYAPPAPDHSDGSRVRHVDSDDTAYVIRTLRRLQVNRTPEPLLAFHREPERLFVTFDSPGSTSLTAERSEQNNLLAHPEVNFNVFLALQGTHLEGFVNQDLVPQTQDARGFWRSYFYPSLLFGTNLALEVLLRYPRLADSARRGLSFILDSQNDDGSWGAESDAYETALAVASLAAYPGTAASVERGVAHLLATMAPDGSWSSRASVWDFPLDGRVLHGYDTHRAYVSARCVTALRRATGQITAFS